MTTPDNKEDKFKKAAQLIFNKGVDGDGYAQAVKEISYGRANKLLRLYLTHRKELETVDDLCQLFDNNFPNG